MHTFNFSGQFERRTHSRSSSLVSVLAVLGMVVGGMAYPLDAVSSSIPLTMDAAPANGPVEVRADAGILRIDWPVTASSRGELVLSLDPRHSLIQSMGIIKADGAVHPLARDVDPLTILTIGRRDPAKAARGMVFFDNPRERPYEVVPAVLDKKKMHVRWQGSRAVIEVGELSAGPFRGHYQFTIFPQSALVRAEAVLRTDQELTAYLYDAGLGGDAPGWARLAWRDPHGHGRKARVALDVAARPLSVGGRSLVAESEGGAFAIFPAPHQYFYPLDFADNFGFAWFGAGWRGVVPGFGFGIRQPVEGDDRWVPWIDAPVGTDQRMSVFYWLSAGSAEEAMDEVARLTRQDRFQALPGHVTFTSHYHVEHTVDYLNRQKAQETTSLPEGLAAPGFVTKFKETGVDIVHLAEFHFGWTPRQPAAERLAMLKLMHEECARLSDEEILVLPGEEPNVHLGGHWISFFPRPVYWVLHREDSVPFVEEVDGYGRVYHVGSPEDVLNLMKAEQGLMWTAHPRIKSSLAYPDGYRGTDFFASDRFLGAAWKAMPADLSRPRLGWRVLDLLDDMNQWGARKQILGEVDVFRVEPDYELYAHMNVNYLRLDRVPRFDEGWGSILRALRAGQFFVTTGEILIRQFRVDGKESGESVVMHGRDEVPWMAELEWTFPLAFAEIVSGNGHQVFRERIDLSDTEAFGRRRLQHRIDLPGRTWVRFEVWDTAANGAFTQPVWIQ